METLNNEIEIIENLSVNQSWKERFKLIQKYYDMSSWAYKVKEEEKENFKQNKPHFAIIFKNGGIGTMIAAVLFGPIYYLVKGMWLKAIIYSLFLILLFSILSILFNFSGAASGGGCLFGILAPFDYYRLKVLKKQW